MKEHKRFLIKDNDLAQSIIDAGHFDKLDFKGMSKGNRDIPIYYFLSVLK